MEEKPVSPVLKVLAALGFLFLLAPVLIVVPLSFSNDVFMSFPPSGYSLRWYVAIGANAKLLDAFVFSVKLASLVTVVNILIAVPASYALIRKAPFGADAIMSLLTAPLLLPTIVLGLALLIVMARAGYLATPQGIVAAAALSFLVSFDEVVLSLFMSGPKVTTLPVELYHHVESRADPLVAAASVLLVVFTLAVVIIVDRSLGLAKTFVK
jgi:putative spermidine/putrescine transport system permease protein